MSTDLGYAAFKPRRSRFIGVVEVGGFRLKHHAITHGRKRFDAAAFESGIAIALDTLPEPALAEGRPGVGIIITHQGDGANYVVVAWWDRENELPLRVIVNDGSGWRSATGSESICVWDLEVLWREREAYVATVLADGGADGVAAYLEATGRG